MLNIGVICPDVETNGVHIPFAKSQLRKLVNDWHGFYLSRVIKIDGATLLMELFARDAGRVTITSDLPYMESGFFDHRAVTPGEELMYWPALVEFSPRVTSLSNTKGLPNAQGHKLKDGDETWTEAGCKPDEKLKDIEVLVGTQGNTLSFTRNEPSFCEPNKIYLRKLMMELFPPSVFTGKMQLFVQALYGSGRDDFRLKVTPGFPPRLELSTHQYTEPPPGEEPKEIFVELLPGYPNNGLFTTDDGRYLLVQMGFGEITYREMRPKFSAAPKKRGTEAEAYLLAQLIPSGKVKTATGSGMPAPSEGTPLAYGWHFNETGSEAAVVLITSAAVNGITAFGGAPITVTGRAAVLYTATFKYNAESKELSYSVALGQTGLFTPAVQGKIFTPNSSGQFMDMMVLGGPGYSIRAEVGPTPVYCFYMRDGSLEIVYTKNATFVVAPGRNDKVGLDPTSGAQLFGSPDVYLPCEREIIVIPESYQTGPAGFAAKAFSHYGSALDAFGSVQREFHHLEVDDPFTYPSGAPPVLYTDLNVSKTKSYFTGISSTGVNISYVAVLVVPFGNASAVISGKEENLATPTVSLKTVGRFFNNSLFRTNNSARAPYPPNSPIPWAYAGLVLYDMTPVGLAPDSAATNSSECEMWLFTAHGKTLLAKSSDSDAASSPNPTPNKIYRGLFEATPNQPVYPYPMTVRSAYFGDEVRHDWCMPQEAPYGGIQSTFVNDWPKDADTPVGWA